MALLEEEKGADGTRSLAALGVVKMEEEEEMNKIKNLPLGMCL